MSNQIAPVFAAAPNFFLNNFIEHKIVIFALQLVIIWLFLSPRSE